MTSRSATMTSSRFRRSAGALVPRASASLRRPVKTAFNRNLTKLVLLRCRNDVDLLGAGHRVTPTIEKTASCIPQHVADRDGLTSWQCARARRGDSVGYDLDIDHCESIHGRRRRPGRRRRASRARRCRRRGRRHRSAGTRQPAGRRPNAGSYRARPVAKSPAAAFTISSCWSKSGTRRSSRLKLIDDQDQTGWQSSYPIDQSKWPASVRPISMSESGGLGVDRSGRLYWDGKPVEIIGQRLDLTWASILGRHFDHDLYRDSCARDHCSSWRRLSGLGLPNWTSVADSLSFGYNRSA